MFELYDAVWRKKQELGGPDPFSHRTIPFTSLTRFFVPTEISGEYLLGDRVTQQNYEAIGEAEDKEEHELVQRLLMYQPMFNSVWVETPVKDQFMGAEVYAVGRGWYIRTWSGIMDETKGRLGVIPGVVDGVFDPTNPKMHERSAIRGSPKKPKTPLRNGVEAYIQLRLIPVPKLVKAVIGDKQWRDLYDVMTGRIYISSLNPKRQKLVFVETGVVGLMTSVWAHTIDAINNRTYERELVPQGQPGHHAGRNSTEDAYRIVKIDLTPEPVAITPPASGSGTGPSKRLHERRSHVRALGECKLGNAGRTNLCEPLSSASGKRSWCGRCFKKLVKVRQYTAGDASLGRVIKDYVIKP